MKIWGGAIRPHIDGVNPPAHPAARTALSIDFLEEVGRADEELAQQLQDLWPADYPMKVRGRPRDGR